jgi:hypothetical protein
MYALKQWILRTYVLLRTLVSCVTLSDIDQKIFISINLEHLTSLVAISYVCFLVKYYFTRINPQTFLG